MPWEQGSLQAQRGSGQHVAAAAHNAHEQVPPRDGANGVLHSAPPPLPLNGVGRSAQFAHDASAAASAADVPRVTLRLSVSRELGAAAAQPLLKYTSRGGGEIRVQCPKVCEVQGSDPGQQPCSVTFGHQRQQTLRLGAMRWSFTAQLFLSLGDSGLKRCKFGGNARHAIFTRQRRHSQAPDDVVLVVALTLEDPVREDSHAAADGGRAVPESPRHLHYMLTGKTVNHDKYAKLLQQDGGAEVCFALQRVTDDNRVLADTHLLP